MGNGQASEAEQGWLFDGGIDLHQLREQGEVLRSVSVRAQLTVRAYESDCRVFTRWCYDAGRNPLPCDEDTVYCYVTWLLTAGKRRGSTAARHVAAIVDSHRRSGQPIPSTLKARQAIKGHRRTYREVPQGKLALTRDDLVSVAESCDPETNRGIRDRAILVLGFASTLQRSELAALQLSDVCFRQEGLAVLVRRSKTDQEGKGRPVGVWAGQRVSTDPVRTLNAWIDRRGKWDGSLFTRITPGDAITRDGIESGDSIGDCIKRAIRLAGIDPRNYGAHSLRAGGATASAELGCSDQEIRRLTGHKSASTMQMYIRSGRLFSGRNPLAGVL
jgi:site-specific recombinase XerD